MALQVPDGTAPASLEDMQTTLSKTIPFLISGNVPELPCSFYCSPSVPLYCSPSEYEASRLTRWFSFQPHKIGACMGTSAREDEQRGTILNASQCHAYVASTSRTRTL